MAHEARACQACGISLAEQSFGTEVRSRLALPPIPLCPDCNTQQRLAFWPFGKFHKRTCDLTKERIISIFPESARFPIYKSSAWHGDAWEAPTLEIDPTKPFFNQLHELQTKTPRPHQFGTKNTECDYCDDVWSSKNCYLCRSLLECENVSYSYRTFYCRDSYDLAYAYHAEQCYDCVYCFKIFNVQHAFDTRDSLDSKFLYDCRNVRNCFMCWNLRNKEFHILNQPYTKAEYFEKLKEFDTGSFSAFQQLVAQFTEAVRREAIHKASFNTKTVNSTGNYLTECKNTQRSFFFEKGEDCYNLFRGLESKDTMDSSGAWDLQRAANTNQVSHGYNIHCINYSENCTDSEYLDSCVNCRNCFGCVGVKNKQYCILNQQYSEEEYGKLVAEIKEKMNADGTYGFFFPYRMATVGYNLTLAELHFPKSSEEIKALGGFTEALEASDASVEVAEAPDNVRDASDDLPLQAVRCEETGRLFNITKDELRFLKQHAIPVPRKYPDVRTVERYKQLAARSHGIVQCTFCDKKVVSYYPKEWGYEKIACEQCYQTEVV